MINCTAGKDDAVNHLTQKVISISVSLILPSDCTSRKPPSAIVSTLQNNFRASQSCLKNNDVWIHLEPSRDHVHLNFHRN